MKFIADFHIHSHYSIATSKDLIPEFLDYWGRVKGINVIGTGDCTHPGWLKELSEKLQPAEQGLFLLKNEYIKNGPIGEDEKVRFMLTCEISNIFKKKGKVRKVHNVIFFPDFESASKFQDKLAKIGNITADGRPILGIDSRDLLEIALSASQEIFFVPAHIWTPWFSVLGDKSGFDTIEECFEDLTQYIYAVETGLSSDPPMNWMCSFLDKYTLISNSDAHSPEKLGREANIFNAELSYNGIINALKSGSPQQFLGTIEFFPQEGKYHYDGHRKCGIVWSPVDTLKHNGLCTVCGKKVTVGVMNRVAQLSDRKDVQEKKAQAPFYSLIPLKELLSEIYEVGPNSKQVNQNYSALIKKLGSEFDILLNLPIEEIGHAGHDLLAEAIRRMRNREVFIKEGFDGEYGVIKVFHESEQKVSYPQADIFGERVHDKAVPYQTKRELINFDLQEYRDLVLNKEIRADVAQEIDTRGYAESEAAWLAGLNKEQKEAVLHLQGPSLIIAGPGTGKTRVLTHRIANLILNHGIDPAQILAVTFTNKAANEMRQRLLELLKNSSDISKVQVCTFHAFGFSILKKFHEKTGRVLPFSIIDDHDTEQILSRHLNCDRAQLKSILKSITEIKQKGVLSDNLKDKNLSQIFNSYQEFLLHNNLFDLDDLIYHAILVLQEYPDALLYYREKCEWILVDEYQDINDAQYQLIMTLMPAAESNLCVIGDPDQAIYGFRGANVVLIQRFKEDYPAAKIYRLKKSYRCTDFILKASHKVIHEETTRLESLLAGLEEGVKISISQHPTDRSEAEFIARAVEKMMGGLRFFSMDSAISAGDESYEVESLSDFAILCRIGRQLDVLEKALNDHSIPYQKITDIPFFKHEPIVSLIELLKYSINNNQFLMQQILDKKILNEDDLYKLSALTDQRTVTAKIESIIDTYFSKEKSISGNKIKELLDIASKFGEDIDEFLKYSALGSEIDTYKANVECVNLMTLHAAKGLEFKCVFIAGCEDGLIPYALFRDQHSNPEEERRLLYVGMTRAKKYLYLSHAKTRYLYGREYHLSKSPFLNRLERDLIELTKSEYKKREKKEDNQLSLF